MKFKKTKKSTKIWTNKEINIEKLSEEIMIALKAVAWQNSPKKEGFSGISVIDDPNWQKKGNPARKQIVIHWTLDGINGFDIQLPEIEKQNIKNTILKHKL